MQTRFYTTAALTALLSAVSGHMIMQSPTPYSAQNLDNSPLTGSNYPCKVTGDPATFYSRDSVTTMAVGETQTLSFKGSAVHGGGSCQLAVTKDLQPSASTSWQVILSIEGGCPSKSGSGPDTYDFQIPDSVAPGDYSFAWTWQSKLAGQPEYYMNCAPITVTGGSSAKRSANNETMELLSRADELPELFVGNMATINDCKTAMSSDAQYPNPGPNVIRPGSNNQFAPVTGTNCVPKGATDNSGSGSDSGSGSGSSSAASSAPAASPTSFVTSTTSAAAAPTTTTSAATTATSAAPATSASSAPASGSSGTPSTGGGLTGACTEEGTFNCVGGSSYQQCASGAWTAMMQMPATTKCQEGKSTTLWGRSAAVVMDPPTAGKSKKSFISLRRRGAGVY
ncbi:hypothetical protein F4775DRAFT_544121 [Biscogniauxia sp. FL1348]|nr:hypothetical protein F4775DRAFT_544121 [Biscogniauxia sp. FL1348]